MDEAARLLREGAGHGTLVVAESQHAGRGRQARNWASLPGNLYTGLIVKPKTDPAHWAQLSFVVALAIHDGIAALLPTHKVVLKWPNDVLVNDAKICGLLLEREDDALIIGFGVNCAHHPDNTPYPATNLGVLLGRAVGPEEVLAPILASFSRHYTAWQEQGFAPIRIRWLDAAKGLNAPIRVVLGERVIEGIFTDIDSKDGALLVKTADTSLVRITAGDVYFGPA